MLFLTLSPAYDLGLGFTLGWLLRLLVYVDYILDWMNINFLVTFLAAVFAAIIVARFVGRQWMPHIIAGGLGWEKNPFTSDNHVPDNPRVPRPPSGRYRKRNLAKRLDYYAGRIGSKKA